MVSQGVLSPREIAEQLKTVRDKVKGVEDDTLLMNAVLEAYDLGFRFGIGAWGQKIDAEAERLLRFERHQVVRFGESC